MMTFEDLEALVAKHIDLIEITSVAISESRSRAAIFLVVQAHLANHLKLLDDVRAKSTTIQNATYAQALMSQSGKNVTENKINAEADPVYSNAREGVELIEAEHNWTKRHFEIFDNAHVMFRQISAQQS